MTEQRRKMKRAKMVPPIWLCSRCFEVKHLHSRGMCRQCYGIQYQVSLRAQNKKVEKDMNEAIAPTKIAHMRPEQIIRDWDRILDGRS